MRAPQPAPPGYPPVPLGLFPRRGLLLALLAAGACPGSTREPVVVNTPGQPGSTLFARLGGMDGVRALVDELVVRLASDPRVEERFARSDFRRFKARLVVQLCEVVGGPCRYRGRPLAEAHAGLGISAAEFDVFLDDVRAAASAVGASQREREELVRLLRGLESEVVGR